MGLPLESRMSVDSMRVVARRHGAASLRGRLRNGSADPNESDVKENCHDQRRGV
jgi:hypothetical protein